MRGVRRRMRGEADNRLIDAYRSASFAAAAQVGKLKPLSHYQRKPSRRMGNREMLANMRILAQRANRAADRQAE